jgi:hypothetical protein
VDIADGAGCAKFSHLAEDVGCDMGAALNIANVFRQLFFFAIGTDEPCLDDDLRHYLTYRSINASCYAT